VKEIRFVGWFEVVAFASAGVITALTVPTMIDASPIYESQMTDGGKPLWITGWVVASYGPLCIAAAFWRLSKRVRYPWLLHLLFVPGALLTLRAGESLMPSVIQDPDFDSTIGAPVMAAIFCSFAAVIIYFGAVIGAFGAKRWQGTKNV